MSEAPQLPTPAATLALRERDDGVSPQRNQDRAPLAWTNERADMLFVGERERKAAATTARSSREASNRTPCARSS